MPYLYKPQMENDYQGYIHSEDDMMITWSYQHLMNVAVANCHKPVTETALRKELKAQIEMAVENAMESFELCKDKMLELINNRE